MRRQFMFGIVLAAAMAVGVGAQSSSPQSTPPSQSPNPQSAYPQSEKQSSKAKDVTVTGCVQKADQAASTTGTTGTTAAGATTTAASDKFVLMNVAPAAAAAGETAGTTGSASSASWANGLKLSPSASDDLDKFVNHKVEIKGSIEAASGAGGSMSSASSAKPTLKISSIRELADTCSGGH
jgi:hypothetical protein